VISQSDIEGRLRLLRYGFIVVVVVTFLVSLLAPYVYTRAMGTSITDFLGNAVIFTIVVGVIAAAVYLGYANMLKRNAGSGSSS
jgi:hypothetical protein